MTRRRRIAAVSAAALLAALGAVAGTATAGAPEGTVANDERSFVTLCRYSHSNHDDPIVLPDRPGMSHEHAFVGNVATDASSTAESLHRTKTTCDRAKDLAAYWAPTLFQAGKRVDPYGAVVYYRRLTTAPVEAYPDLLTVVAGDSHATRAQSRRVVFWDCGVVKTTLYGPMAREPQPVAAPPAASSTPPACPPASKLQLHVNFPDCWDGEHADSVDHKRHMAYSQDGRCPRSHPVPVPALSLVYQYPPVSGALALSSGPVYTAHADFMNAWDERTLKGLIGRCLNARRPCGTGELGG